MSAADGNEPRYSIGELAERGGVSRRTVRYYVQRGLLPPPEGAGRGARYTARHLDRLVRVREQQEAGVPLERIEAALAGMPDGVPPDGAPSGSPAASGAPALDRWTRVVVADGVELHLRGALPARDELRAAVAALRKTLRRR